uniref:Uncharacterized protein n=1 Tax=Anguilla anguilla TaxID=7936 RepID=A0A0E9TME7_ANGAN
MMNHCSSVGGQPPPHCVCAVQPFINWS